MKTVMLAVTGLSPQVITETLYALHQSSRHVDAIHVITTLSIFRLFLSEITCPEIF